MDIQLGNQLQEIILIAYLLKLTNMNIKWCHPVHSPINQCIKRFFLSQNSEMGIVVATIAIFYT